MSETEAENATNEETTQASDTIALSKVVDERGVPLGNVLKEITRKMGRFSEMNAKLDMLVQQGSGSTQSPDKGAAAKAAEGIDARTKSYIDSRLEEEKLAEIAEAQNKALDVVFKTFPELLKESDDFDSEFFELAVKHENSINKNDPERSLKAAKLAALELGKIERIQKAKLLQDENRRTRILTEGSSSKDGGKSSQSSKNKMTQNDEMIQKWFKVDPKKVAKMAKEEGTN